VHITIIKLTEQVLINKRKVEKRSQLIINKVIRVCLVKTLMGNGKDEKQNQKNMIN